MTALANETVRPIIERVDRALTQFAQRFPGQTTTAQPVHTVYGGAHLFAADTIPKLNAMALKSFGDYAPSQEDLADVFGISDGPLAARVFERLRARLGAEPIQDFRIDFEDGYGYRRDEEEDADAVRSAAQAAAAAQKKCLPPFFGLRIKPLAGTTQLRAVRTLDLFFETLLQQGGGWLGERFAVTLPKIVVPEQVCALVELLELVEARHGLTAGTVKIELLIEQPQLFINAGGNSSLIALVDAARGRCRGAHLGAYDYTSSCGIVGSVLRLDHPACDLARQLMQIGLSQTGVWLSDGATTVLPVAPHRDGKPLSAAQKQENKQVVQAAWRLHYENVLHALDNGFFQGWDLHPAQVVARYAALYVFFLSSVQAMSERLGSFVKKAAQANLVGSTFDDAATGQGLINYFLRGLNCGALKPEDLAPTGLTIDDLKTRSFMQIVGGL